MEGVSSAEEPMPASGDIWSIAGRSTRAIVDLDAIAGNLGSFRSRISPATCLMAVVKANGYGHGAVMVARTVLDLGASDLGVATVGEGLQLRRAGIRAPILVLGPIDESEIGAAVAGHLAVSLADRRLVSAVACVADSGASADVHLKIDTGMSRYGAAAGDAVEIASLIASLPSLRLAGTFTHFARADEADETPTVEQLATFDAAVDAIRAAGIDPGRLHVANSGATLRTRRYDRDMVRIGIALYGIAPSADVTLWPEMRPALTVRSRVRRAFLLRRGDRVSYGGTYVAAGEESAALIPVGYADGYHRLLSNRSWMAVGDERVAVRGRVCMDQTVVGWSSVVDVDVGREVVVVGDGSGAAPTLSQLAAIAGTIPYELATALAPRVPRIYLRHGRVVAVEDLTGLRNAAPDPS
jgi:alanine racemase